jgi:type VI secretion system protein ImpK
MGQGISRNQVDIAKYLLCSLLDETVLNTPWGSQSGWGHSSLSSLFYKKLVGGEEFFQLLDRMKQQPSEYGDLLELAYLCLSLGFEGKYRYTGSGLMTLERERREVFLLLRRMRGDGGPGLSAHWQGVQDRQNILIRHVPLWVLGGIAGVLLMFSYMAFAFSIRDRSDQVYDQLYAVGQSIEGAQLSRFVHPLETKPAATALSVNGLRQLFADEIARNAMDVVDGPGLRLFDVFQSGSADIKAAYQTVLTKIAKVLRAKNAGITVIGHTDNQRLKFSSRYKSNWHLSVARAHSTAQALVHYGLPEQQIEFEGMADKAPIASNTTKAGRALNRRIDILIR